METKINVAEILKDKPVNTKLYSPLFGDVYLSNVGDSIVDVKHHAGVSKFFDSGRYYNYDESEPLLFPSMEMRDWSKFAWKPGDVLVNSDKSVHIIFEKFEDGAYKKFYGQYYLWEEGGSMMDFEEDEDYMQTSDFNKANKEDAQEYIYKIEKILGGKLNRETLEIGKAQPEFKDGDIVVVDEIPFDLYSKCIFILKENLNTGEIKARSYVLYNVTKDSIFFDTPITKVIERNIHLAIDEEKQQLFSALEKEGKAWDSEHKMIVDSKPKVEFKPFDKVLVRDNDTEPWMPAFFEREYKHKFFLLSGFCFNQCIPYEGNESLLGTTKGEES